MQYRRSDYDVTNTVQVSSVAAVRRAVEDLYVRTWPSGPVDRLGAAFTDFERLFNGQFPGYLGCDTIYHDLQHTLDDTLAMARLLVGYERSHAPEQLQRLLDALQGADLVIGSRYVPGGRVVNWPWHRQLLSRGGNVYTRLLLGMPVRDATAGYRVFRRTTLERIHLDEVVSLGYVFQADLAFRGVRAGLRVVEVPIDFVEREIGESKMSPQVAVESLKRITRWGLSERAGQLRGALEQRRHPTR